MLLVFLMAIAGLSGGNAMEGRPGRGSASALVFSAAESVVLTNAVSSSV